MKTIFLKLFKSTILKVVLGYLDKPETKKKWVDKINKRIDLPGLDEKEEEKLFNGIIEAGFEEIREIIKGI